MRALEWLAGAAVVIGLLAACGTFSPDRFPEKPSDLSPTLIVLLGLWGGVLSALRRFAGRRPVRERVLAALIDLVAAPFWGITAFYMCLGAQASLPLTIVAVAYVSHLGPRAMALYGRRILQRAFRIDVDDSDDNNGDDAGDRAARDGRRRRTGRGTGADDVDDDNGHAAGGSGGGDRGGRRSNEQGERETGPR